MKTAFAAKNDGIYKKTIVYNIRLFKEKNPQQYAYCNKYNMTTD